MTSPQFNVPSFTSFGILRALFRDSRLLAFRSYPVHHLSFQDPCQSHLANKSGVERFSRRWIEHVIIDLDEPRICTLSAPHPFLYKYVSLFRTPAYASLGFFFCIYTNSRLRYLRFLFVESLTCFYLAQVSIYPF